MFMRFDLTNTPSTFMRLMNPILRECLGNFFVVYFYDIIIYRKSLEDHCHHLMVVLEVIR